MKAIKSRGKRKRASLKSPFVNGRIMSGRSLRIYSKCSAESVSVGGFESRSVNPLCGFSITNCYRLSPAAATDDLSLCADCTTQNLSLWFIVISLNSTAPIHSTKWTLEVLPRKSTQLGSMPHCEIIISIQEILILHFHSEWTKKNYLSFWSFANRDTFSPRMNERETESIRIFLSQVIWNANEFSSFFFLQSNLWKITKKRRTTQRLCVRGERTLTTDEAF